MNHELIIDSFAGGGGASLGIAWAVGRAPDIAINHDGDALAMHAENHPATQHVLEDVWRADLRKLVGRRAVGLLWASPDCRHFSRAKGGKPVSKQVRSLAWIVCKWAEQVQPRLICLENVREFADWGPLVPAYRCAECEWRGTEGQATLVRIRRRCPRCESLRLRVTEELIPDPFRRGLTFKRFICRLKKQGYHVEWRNLDAADYGAPTHRKRLFLVARRDGEPITWPEPAFCHPHKIVSGGLFADERKPYRTAAQCIDWDIPCPSIFARKKPLAEKTMRRIAEGIRRYVLDDPQPFIVRYNSEKSPGDNRTQSIDDPFSTLDTQNRFGVVTPVLVGAGGPEYGAKPKRADEPFTTLTAENHRAVITPFLTPITHVGERRSHAANEPMPTVTRAHRGEFAVVAPTLVQTGYGERDGQAPRTLDLDQPLGTVVGGGAKHALVSAFLAKHFGGVVGVPADSPLPTTTVRATQNQIVAANLVRFNHDDAGLPVDAPLPTVTSNNHAALVYSFLVRYFGTAIGQHLTEPMFTVTGKDRFGLVTVTINGEPYVIVDIGMRMLTPRELARAQGFPDTYILRGTKTSQVARIGNSVCPPIAAAVVEANYCRQPAEVVA